MWCEALESNIFLVSLYGQVPELKDVRIAEINIRDEGRIVEVKFDMPHYAEMPPKKWVELGGNTVAVRIDLWGIQEVTLGSGISDYRADIEIFKNEADLIVVKIIGTVNAVIKAGAGMIQTVTSYCNGMPE
ncbi:Imm50 family immunity protein [Paenibacillus gorillae]|uniref:Imm50 family immunity protein n=1 Tax=Paenibacillus gorillae TaxID=1243662 RepID=UPI0004B9D107|nr:Imm50 family immunity protein [Paenibacillus gorillae]